MAWWVATFGGLGGKWEDLSVERLSVSLAEVVIMRSVSRGGTRNPFEVTDEAGTSPRT